MACSHVHVLSGPVWDSEICWSMAGGGGLILSGGTGLGPVVFGAFQFGAVFCCAGWFTQMDEYESETFSMDCIRWNVVVWCL